MSAQRVDGIDISRYQSGALDMKKAKAAGLKWLYHKVTEGNKSVWQAQYNKRRKEAKAAGIPFGAYHFARAEKPTAADAVAEAKHFLSAAKPVAGDLHPCLDLETTEGLSTAQLKEWARAFIGELKRQGFKCVLYTNFDLGDVGQALTWRARYNNDNKPPALGGWDIWQFSNGVYGNPKSFPGFGNVDLNTMRAGLKVEQMIHGGSTSAPAQPNKMDPKAYFIGAKGAHVTWLGERLVLHLKALGKKAPYKVGPGPTFTATDQAAVKVFQQAQGWSGADADGFPGPETLKRLAADPKPVVPAPVKKSLTLKVSTANIQNFNPNLPPAQVEEDMAKMKRISNLILWQELAEDRDFNSLIKVMGNTDWGNTAHGNECMISWLRAVGTIKLSENVKVADKAPGKFSPARKVKRLVLDTPIGEVEVICVHFTNGARKDPARVPFWNDCWEGTNKLVDQALKAGRIVIVGGDWNWPTNKVKKFDPSMRWVVGGGPGIDGVAVCLPKGVTVEVKGKADTVTPLNSDHDGRTRTIVLSR